MEYNELTGDTGNYPNLNEVAQAGDKLLRVVREWRERLGADRSLLDQYLAGILTAMTNTTDAYRTAGEGFEFGTSTLRAILRSIKEGNEDEARTYPFYPKVRAYMDAHPLPQDANTYDLYYMGLFLEYVPFAIQGYIDECNAAFKEHLEEENVQQISEALLSSGAVTADDLSFLHGLILQIITWVTPSSIFAQGMVDQMLLALIGQDEESDANVFQRILEGEA
jgi:hypothetical protein